jgi:flagellin
LTNDGGAPVYDTKTISAGNTVEFSNGISIATNAAALANSANTTFEVKNTTIDNSLKMQVGANSGQTFSIDVSDMRADALGISTINKADTFVDEKGSIIANAAWTSEEAATDGTSNNEEEYALSVANSTEATAAIKVIDVAIGKVSSERSKLGAFQNRLEHTINNLGTSAENLTAAESRIRDVDMANEMMEFTKNNILQQAAQAMLAQANQQPQGVLQLLR